MPKDVLSDTAFPLREGDVVCVYKKGRISFTRPGSGSIHDGHGNNVVQLMFPRQELIVDKHSAFSLLTLICRVTNSSFEFMEDSAEDRFFFKIKAIRTN